MKIRLEIIRRGKGLKVIDDRLQVDQRGKRDQFAMDVVKQLFNGDRLGGPALLRWRCRRGQT